MKEKSIRFFFIFTQPIPDVDVTDSANAVAGFDHL